MALLVIVSLRVLTGGFARAADVVVNEYNAVNEGLYLRIELPHPIRTPRRELAGLQLRLTAWRPGRLRYLRIARVMMGRTR
jgi:hypothetical protein